MSKQYKYMVKQRNDSRNKETKVKKRPTNKIRTRREKVEPSKEIQTNTREGNKKQDKIFRLGTWNVKSIKE